MQTPADLVLQVFLTGSGRLKQNRERPGDHFCAPRVLVFWSFGATGAAGADRGSPEVGLEVAPLHLVAWNGERWSGKSWKWNV